MDAFAICASDARSECEVERLRAEVKRPLAENQQLRNQQR